MRLAGLEVDFRRLRRLFEPIGYRLRRAGIEGKVAQKTAIPETDQPQVCSNGDVIIF
jgi:hypothetical protein